MNFEKVRNNEVVTEGGAVNSQRSLKVKVKVTVRKK